MSLSWSCLHMLQAGGLLLDSFENSLSFARWQLLLNDLKNCSKLLGSDIDLGLCVLIFGPFKQSRLVSWNKIFEASSIFDILPGCSFIHLRLQLVDSLEDLLLIGCKVSLSAPASAFAKDNLFNLAGRAYRFFVKFSIFLGVNRSLRLRDILRTVRKGDWQILAL